MALWIKATGESVEVQPENGKSFTLGELQRMVGGYIEPVYLNDGDIMWVNEEGRLQGLPLNREGCDIMRRRSRLDPANIIVGDVVVMTREESGDGEDEQEEDE